MEVSGRDKGSRRDSARAIRTCRGKAQNGRIWEGRNPKPWSRTLHPNSPRSIAIALPKWPLLPPCRVSGQSVWRPCPMQQHACAVPPPPGYPLPPVEPPYPVHHMIYIIIIYHYIYIIVQYKGRRYTSPSRTSLATSHWPPCPESCTVFNIYNVM